MIFEGIAKSLSSFIKYAAKNPLWTFGWTVFLASASFTITFFVDYPNQQAQMDSNTARFNTYTQDYDEFAQVIQILKDSNESFIAVTERNNIISKKITNKEFVPQDEINSAIAEAQETRIILSTSAGTLRGITFNDESLDQYVQEFSKNISEKEKVTVAILDYYQGGLSQDKEKIIKAVAVLQDYSVKLYEQESENIERLKNFQEKFNNFHTKNTIDINNETNNLVVYSWKLKLVAATMLYSIIFPIFGAYVWIKNSRFKKNVRPKGKPNPKK